MPTVQQRAPSVASTSRTMEQQPAPVIPQFPICSPLQGAYHPHLIINPFLRLQSSRVPPTRNSQRGMEPQRNSTSDTDSMLSGRAPMPMHCFKPRLPPLPEVKITRVQDSRAKTITVYEDAGATTGLTPCPRRSAPSLRPPPAPVAQPLPQAPPIVCGPSWCHL